MIDSNTPRQQLLRTAERLVQILKIVDAPDGLICRAVALLMQQALVLNPVEFGAQLGEVLGAPVRAWHGRYTECGEVMPQSYAGDDTGQCTACSEESEYQPDGPGMDT